MPNSKFTVFLFFSFFEAITIPLYFRLLYVLFKRPKFSTPFYRFLIVNGFTVFFFNFSFNFIFFRIFWIIPSSKCLPFCQFSMFHWVNILPKHCHPTFLGQFFSPLSILHINKICSIFPCHWIDSLVFSSHSSMKRH